MNRFVHIVCLDAPAPPDYGGVIDLYYKIKTFWEAGIKVILHYFDYRNRNISSIEKYCVEIHAYPRKTGIAGIDFSLPYIVASRINNELIKRLNQDDYPVILEGFHCTGPLPFLKFGKTVIIRVHNNEAAYYQQLSRLEKNLLKKIYFVWESKQLHQYQKKLPHRVPYICVAQKDAAALTETYHLPDVSFLPCFIPWQAVESKTGKGYYCLYHGNLLVSENKLAAEWLIHTVFLNLNIPLVIAGRGAHQLQNLTKKYTHIAIADHPDEKELTTLIQNAQVNILPSFNHTGVKLKLLHALFQGRYCITNTAGALEAKTNIGLHIADDPAAIIANIRQLMNQCFSNKDIEQRKSLLQLYNNETNVQQLITYLY